MDAAGFFFTSEPAEDTGCPDKIFFVISALFAVGLQLPDLALPKVD